MDNLEIGTNNNNNNNSKMLTVNVSNPKVVSQSVNPKHDSFGPAYAIIYRDSDLILTNKALAMSMDKICKCVIGYFVINNINPTNLASIVTKYISNGKNNNDQASIIQTQCSQRLDHNVSHSHSNTNPFRKLFLLNMPMTTHTTNKNDNINSTYVWNTSSKTYLQLHSPPKKCLELSHSNINSWGRIKRRSSKSYWIQCGIIGVDRSNSNELLQRFFNYFQKSKNNEFYESRFDIRDILYITKDEDLNLQYGKNVDAFWMTNYYYPNSDTDAGACEVGHNDHITVIKMPTSIFSSEYSQYMNRKVLQYGDWIEMSIDVSHEYPSLCFQKNNEKRYRTTLMTSCHLKDAQPNDFLYIPFFCVLACDCGFDESYFSYELSIDQ